MKPWQRTFQIARRDFLQRGQSRVFIIATGALIAIILGGVPLMVGLVNNTTAAPIGIVAEPQAGFEEALTTAATMLDVTIEVKRFGSRQDGAAALEKGDVEALVDQRQIVYQSRIIGELQSLLATAFGIADRQAAGADLGLSSDQLAQLLNPVPPEVIVASGLDANRDVKGFAAYIGVVFLFVAIVMFGQFVLLGVLEEKANRVAEVVLSRVRPIELLAGKVVGIGLLGLIQLLAIGGSLVFVLARIELAGLPSLGELSTSVFLAVVMWFLLGYSLYSALFAAAGALISRQEDVQAVSWIPILTIMPGYVISLMASTNPEANIVEVASMLPLTAPMVMLVRSAALDVPGWQMAVAIGVTLLTTFIVMRIAARVYRGGILQSGRTKLREAWGQAPRSSFRP